MRHSDLFKWTCVFDLVGPFLSQHGPRLFTRDKLVQTLVGLFQDRAHLYPQRGRSVIHIHVVNMSFLDILWVKLLLAALVDFLASFIHHFV